MTGTGVVPFMTGTGVAPFMTGTGVVPLVQKLDNGTDGVRFESLQKQEIS
jgi:hypothetical protein